MDLYDFLQDSIGFIVPKSLIGNLSKVLSKKLQVEPIKHYPISKYRSVFQACSLIVKEEGITALWKGHVPAQLLSVVYGMSQFYSYNLFMQYSKEFPLVADYRLSLQLPAGAFAGIVSTVISYPFDTVRTRLVAQSTNHKVYNGFFHSCISILRHDSPTVFFRGLLPTVLQVAPHTGFQFYFFGVFKDVYSLFTQDSSTSATGAMIAGAASGVVSKTIVYPFDLVRKRLQIQGFKRARKGFGAFFQCSGMMNCVVETMKKEGFTGLFKGLAPSQYKAAATTAFHFTVYEQTLILIKTLN